MATEMGIPQRPVSPNVKPYYFSGTLPTGHFEPRASQPCPSAKIITEHRGWRLMHFRLDDIYMAVSPNGNYCYMGRYQSHQEAAAMFPEWLHAYRGVER